ncbi:MAG: prolyl-tRNA synthetase associated domain-containing protein [Parvibaculaceae bacterium]
MPATSAELFQRLDTLGIRTSTVEHPPVFTVEEAQALRGEIAGAHSKNLFFKDKKDTLWLVVCLEDAEIDLKSLHHRIGAARLSFGKPELLREILGIEPGSVTPFALINDEGARVRVVLDARMMGHEKLNFHPLRNTATTTIASADLEKFVRATGHDPLIAEIA